MYNTELIAMNIKNCAKSKGIALHTMLSDLHLGINTISKLSSGTGISYIDFARIADYLSVSVDFLLGRNTATLVSLPTEQQQLLSDYELLEHKQKQTVREYIASLAEIAKYQAAAAIAKENVS